jgi:hypothetical protein
MDQGRTKDQGRTRDEEQRTKDLYYMDFEKRSSVVSTHLIARRTLKAPAILRFVAL